MLFLSGKCIRESANSGRCSKVEGGLCYNEWCPFSGDDLNTHHIQPVKVRQLDAPYLRSFLDYHADSSLCVSVCHCDHLQSHLIVYHTVSTIRLFCDLGLRQEH